MTWLLAVVRELREGTGWGSFMSKNHGVDLRLVFWTWEDSHAIPNVGVVMWYVPEPIRMAFDISFEMFLINRDEEIMKTNKNEMMAHPFTH